MINADSLNPLIGSDLLLRRIPVMLRRKQGNVERRIITRFIQPGGRLSGFLSAMRSRRVRERDLSCVPFRHPQMTF